MDVKTPSLQPMINLQKQGSKTLTEEKTRTLCKMTKEQTVSTFQLHKNTQANFEAMGADLDAATKLY
ncbi:hypothetical protein SLE2022_393360 [Rubroshorea leprosula]